MFMIKGVTTEGKTHPKTATDGAVAKQKGGAAFPMIGRSL